MAKPDAAVIREVVETIRTAEDFEYFFDQLRSSDWVDALAEAHLFDSPPDPVSSDRGVQFPAWAASRYLARVAGEDPVAVCRVLRRFPPTENVRVLNDLADVLLAIPPAMAVEFVPTFSDWLETRLPILLPRKAAALIRRLALAREVRPALQLAQTLFRFGSDDGNPPQLRVTAALRDYEYEQLLTECREDLIAGTGFEGFALLLDLLEGVVAGEAHEPDREGRDLSWVWRRAIESNRQNSVPSIGSTLVSAVRDSGLQLASSNRRAFTETIGLLEQRRLTVFRRIELNVIREQAPRRSAAVTQSLLSRSNLYSNELHHEYWMLLHDRFSLLTDLQRRQLLRSIEVGPPIYRARNGEDPSRAEMAREVWQSRFLAAIAEFLPEAEQRWFEELLAKNRLGEHPEFLMFSTGMWVGPTSPLNDDEISVMAPDELISFLRRWEPDQELMSPSAEGLSQALAAAAKANPIAYTERAEQFRELRPTYVNGLLSGIREAVSAKDPVLWEPILQLIAWLAGPGRASAEGMSTLGDVNPGWTWAKSTAAHLLDAGFNGGVSEIPYELRELAWSALGPLTGDPHPSPDEEERFGGSNMDPSTLAINTVRGLSIQALVKYALWVHRHEPTHRGFDVMPEVREVLDAHLHIDEEPSYAVRSMYGQWFPWLHLVDAEWTQAQVAVIFPAADELRLYWEAAWEAYVSFCQPFDSVLPTLRGEYLRAIERIESTSRDRRHPMLTFERLAQHLVLFYLRGQIAINEEPLASFFELSPEPLRASALQFLGRSLYTIVEPSVVLPLAPAPSREVVKRATELWEARVQVASDADHALEVAKFGWWFPAPAFPGAWALENLVRALQVAGRIEANHLVLKRLAELASAYPNEVLRAFDLMISGDQSDWVVMAQPEASIEILRALLAVTDGSVHRRALEITNLLGARGYRQFRVLIGVNEG